MPNFPIIDSHVHLWDPQRFRMSWLEGHALLDQPYGLTDYQAHTRGIEIEALVYLQVDVEAPYALLEAQWITQQAATEPRIQGIVPFAPVEYGEQSRAFLEALVALGPRIKGVRRLLQSEPDPNYCLQPKFVRGVQILPEYNLSFDICVKHSQLEGAIELVRQCPNTQFVLDHIGKPSIKAGLLDPWRARITQLAALPNVSCKVSGLATEADPGHWTSEDLAPYVTHILETFGEARVMFGGDWPVVLEASSYVRWVQTLDALTAQLSTEAQHKLWAENARRFYRLNSILR